MGKTCAAAMILALFLNSCGGEDKADQSTTEPAKKETAGAQTTSAKPEPKKAAPSGRKEAYAAVKAVYGAKSTPSQRCNAVDPIYMEKYKQDLDAGSTNVGRPDSCTTLAKIGGDPGLLEGTLKSATFYAASTDPARDIANGRDLWEFVLEGDSNPCEGESTVVQAARKGTKWLIVYGGCGATIAEDYELPDDAVE